MSFGRGAPTGAKRLHIRISVLVALTVAGIFLYSQVVLVLAFSSSSTASATSASISSVTLDNGSTADSTITVSGFATGAIFNYFNDSCGALHNQPQSYQYTGALVISLIMGAPVSSQSTNFHGGAGFYSGCIAPPGALEFSGNYSVVLDVSGLSNGTHVVTIAVTTRNLGPGSDSTVVVSQTFDVQHPPACTITVQGQLNGGNAATGAQYEIFGPTHFSGTDGGTGSFTAPGDSVYQLIIVDGLRKIQGYDAIPNGSSAGSCNSANSQHIFLQVPYITTPILMVR